MPAPDAAIRPTRMAEPPAGRAALELLHYPLYSAAALDAAALPRQLQFFSYRVGGTVSGAGSAAITATPFHTNLETPNFLAAPKTFTVQGVRVVMSPLSYAGGLAAIQDTALTALTAHQQFEDLLRLTTSAALRFFVGPKDYVQAPLFACPGNAGIAGLAGVSVSDTNAAVSVARRVSAHTMGRGFDMRQWPVLLANQQSFGAELSCNWTTNPSLAVQRLVFVVLDGILGREVS